MTRLRAEPAALADSLLGEIGRRGGGPVAFDSSPLTRLTMSRDASHYERLPLAVARPRSETEMSDLLSACHALGQHVTFRAGGTSLSGQAVSDGLVVDTRSGFRGVTVAGDATHVTAEPGVTIRQVNARLRGARRMLGPDPASEIACTIGGAIANNSSGMTCGTHANAYRTVRSLRAVMADGTVVDTQTQGGRDRFRRDHAPLHRGLAALRHRIVSDPRAVAEIHRQFSMKNTMGYSINAFLDFEDPVDIFSHLIVGSEGTLAFVSSAVLATVPSAEHRATALLLFETAHEAVEAIGPLSRSGALAVELMNAASLRPRRHQARLHPLVDQGAALLVEYAEDDAGALAARSSDFTTLAATLPCTTNGLTQDASTRQELWTLRKGLLTTAASTRPPGTTSLLEDVSFPGDSLLGAITDLEVLLDDHGYRATPIFGHAKDANLHFLIAEDFGRASAVSRYAAFTDELVDLVLSHRGSLKAEHGTGRVMAPFVARQYGEGLFEVMREVKDLFDPAGVLNPGVIISEDSHAHLRHLKTSVAVDPIVDSCIECGFCEPACPSATLTTTPRQRIVIERVTATLPPDSPMRRGTEQAAGYAVVDTCAADGICAAACPVAINTGDLVKDKRAAALGPWAQRAASVAAGRWQLCLLLVRTGLRLVHAAPALGRIVYRLMRRMHGLPPASLPVDLPLPARGRAVGRSDPTSRAVYFPSCLGDVFAAPDGPGVGKAFLSLCTKSGVTVSIPPGVAGSCCAVPWTSKGLRDGARVMAARTLGLLWEESDGGRLPVVCDAASCTQGLTQLRPHLSEADQDRFDRLRILDALTFVEAELLPRLTTTTTVRDVTVHATCATDKLHISGTLSRLAGLAADTVITPPDEGCCGFAGDRGFLLPELTAAATRAEASDVRARPTAAYVSANATCELGMTRATGRPYRHVLELLDQCTQPQDR